MAPNDQELVQKVSKFSVKLIELRYLHPLKCANAIWTHRCSACGLVILEFLIELHVAELYDAVCHKPRKWRTSWLMFIHYDHYVFTINLFCRDFI